ELGVVFFVGPAQAAVVPFGHGGDEPIDVALDAFTVLDPARFGKDHGLEADHVGVRRFDLAKVGQAAVDDFVVRLDLAGVEWSQHGQASPSSRYANAGFIHPIPVASTTLLVAQILNAILDGVAHLIDQLF